MKDRDRYGGWTGRRFAPSGFFRLEQAGRWWLVTPDGNAFLSFGLNHVQPVLVSRPYNRAFWEQRLGPFEGERDPKLLAWLTDKARRDLDAFGMNTLGCHSPVEHYPAPFCPYVHPIHFAPISHWQMPGPGDFPDVFSDEFAAHCRRLAEERAAPRRDDPLLLGYSFVDCPILTDLDARERGVCVYGNARAATPTWPRVLTNLGPDAPAKRAYVETVHGIYGGDVAGFNATYGTAFDSFDALLSATDWREHVDESSELERRDNLAFLERVVDRYYETAVGAIRAADPRHMIFGDKLNMNTGVPDAVVRAVGRHVDVLLFQHYGHYEEQRPHMDRWHELTGRPLLNGDSSFSVPDEHMSFTLGPHCRDQQERAEAFLTYARAAFARPDFVGWHWCGWMDQWEEVQPGRQHSGLQTPFGELYEPMREAMHGFLEQMYEPACGQE